MATVITHSTGTITPVVVDGFDAAREARSIVHTILGRPDPDVTFRPVGLRRGTLALVFATGADAAAAVAALSVPQLFALIDSDVPEVGMSFVISGGDIRTVLDDETRTVWVVEVPFQEVSP